MKIIFIPLLLIIFSIIPLFSIEGEIGKPVIKIDSFNGYYKELINFEIDIPDATEDNELEIKVEVVEGDGVVLTSRIFYSISMDVENDTVEIMTTNKIGFVPLSTGVVSLKAVVIDLSNSDELLISDEIKLNLEPLPSLFGTHKHFIKPILYKDQYYVGEQILISYDLFFSDGVQAIDKIYIHNSSVKFTESPKKRIVYYNREATTVSGLKSSIIVPGTPGVLTLPSKIIPITIIDKTGTKKHSSIELEPINIKILEIPITEETIIGSDLEINVENFPGGLKFGESFSFNINIKGQINLDNIKTLKTYIDLPGIYTESIIEQKREVRDGKILGSMVFNYQGVYNSHFNYRKTILEISFYNTLSGETEMIKEIFPEIKGEFPRWIVILLLVATSFVFIIKNKIGIRYKADNQIHKGIPGGKHVPAKKYDTVKIVEPEVVDTLEKSAGLTGFAKKYMITTREQEIVHLLGNGKTTKDMAEQLFISPETVKKHIRNLMKKTNTHSRYEIYVLYQEFIPRI